MSYATDEGSVEANAPRELFTISVNDGIGDTYRHTSAATDIAYGGNVYTAIALERGEIAITMPGEEKDLVITIPVDHPIARRYTQQGQPPNKITCTLVRQQSGGDAQTIWVGDVQSMAFEGRVAKLRVPSRAGEYMMRSVPSALVSRACPHMLYSSMCRVSRAGVAPTSGIAFKQTVTITAVSGVDITVNLAAVTATDTYRAAWAENGEVYHPLTGERSTVRLQTDSSPGVGTSAKLTLANVIVGLKIGDSVDVYAGCDWLPLTCSGKFDNRQNHGGLPVMPTGNPFVLIGSGVRQ